MESDRLLQPVFREFYSERDVVHEERRLRIESTPTGQASRSSSTPCSGLAPLQVARSIGWPSDLEDRSVDGRRAGLLLDLLRAQEPHRRRWSATSTRPRRRRSPRSTSAASRRGAGRLPDMSHARGAAARREADERRVRLPAAGLGAVPHRAVRAQGQYALDVVAEPAQRPAPGGSEEPGARPADRRRRPPPGSDSLQVERLVLPRGRDQGRGDAGGSSKRRSGPSSSRLAERAGAGRRARRRSRTRSSPSRTATSRIRSSSCCSCCSTTAGATGSTSTSGRRGRSR